MLITCGKCGNDVSDKALKCPKCKTPVKPVGIACPECGKEDLSEQDLGSECPHCGYPLRHLRLSQTAAQAIPPAQVAKAAALECPNCGCVLPGGASASGKCPNCGFAMRPELPQAPKPPEPKRSVFNPRSYFHYPAENAAPKPKEAEKPKSRLRMAAESLFWILLISALLMGSGYLAMKFDMLGVKSALRTASNSEETEESIKGSFSDFRLWLKHVASVFVDQFPDSSGPASTGSEGQSR